MPSPNWNWPSASRCCSRCTPRRCAATTSPVKCCGCRRSQLLQLPPLHTVLRGGKRAGAKRVPVTLAAKCTEIGTLELYCVSKEGNRWRLEFNVRDVLREPSKEDEEADASGGVIDVFPEEKVQEAGALIRRCSAPCRRRAKPPTTSDLPKLLEAALESPRSDWPTGLCRRLWEFLEADAAGRGKSPAHLSRWYNLAGFCLRPGFGDPLDRYRVEALWKLITAAASADGHRPEEGDRARGRGGLLDHVAAGQRRAERGPPAGAVHAPEAGAAAGEGEGVLAPAGERVRRDVAGRRQPRTPRRQDEGGARRGGGARLQEVAGADLRVLGADAARLARAALRPAEHASFTRRSWSSGSRSCCRSSRATTARRMAGCSACRNSRGRADFGRWMSAIRPATACWARCGRTRAPGRGSGWWKRLSPRRARTSRGCSARACQSGCDCRGVDSSVAGLCEAGAAEVEPIARS